MKMSIKKVIITSFATTILFLISCEREDIQPEINTDLTTQTSQNEYTDEELIKTLEEEQELIKLEKQGYIVDISGMEIEKKNPKKVYVHYMPWFQSKEYDGFWGQHWTMTNQNPELIDENGKKQVASYFYPIIGPYSSSDPDLHEYHFLMMKLSGIDGVVFDWYGSRNQHDYDLIKQATETFIDKIEDLGLKFSIMYEDRVAVQAVEQSLEPTIIKAVQEDFIYIKNNYFSSPEYLKHSGKNLLFVFGPHYVTNQSDWNEIFDVLPTEEHPEFLTLWAANQRVGINATGEFLWVDKDHLLAHEYYYNTYDINDMITVGSSYPGFKSFYEEGGWSNGENNWSLDVNKYTFTETLNYTHHQLSDFIQIITWNDFGEGTMIEPTEEFGYTYLQLLQQYTGVPYTPEDLQRAFKLYQTRKEYQDNQEAQDYLDRTYKYIKQLNLQRADKIISAINRFL